ncbi:MAG: hypothetical protein Q7S45_04805 [Candidatus Curtissbacteria bacterium]|nr:hypothetical protein [Candidatus Curtissbacteria bacterium]
MNRNSGVKILREKYPVFEYSSFSYKKKAKSLVISFLFKIRPDIVFEPVLEIKNVDNFENIENFIFHLGLIEMLSYWKVTCSPLIKIKAGSLNQKQINWWKNLLIKGLGEFFYQNDIDFKEEDFVRIESAGKKLFQYDKVGHKDRYLILNGGGRDSVVSLEFLKELKKQTKILMLNPTQAQLAVTRVSGVDNPIIVKREIDKRLLDLNQKGYLNGHTPFSAYLSFLSILCSKLFDYKYIISSNERSSNEGNLEFKGEKINHQYSKSFEFEKSFRQYAKENLSDDIEYLSLLRPLYEIQISRIFSNYKQYFGAFKSCNRGQKTNSWCGKCPKCLSIFISLYPFVGEGQAEIIFGKNLYKDTDLVGLLGEISGEGENKPFECVGTFEEILTGLYLSSKKAGEQLKELPLLEFAVSEILPKYNMEEIQERIINGWDDENFLPGKIVTTLKNNV